MWLSYLEKILSFNLTPTWIFLKTAITAVITNFFFGTITVGWGLRYQGKSQEIVDPTLTFLLWPLLTKLCYLKSLFDKMFSSVKLWFYIQEILKARIWERGSLALSTARKCVSKLLSNKPQRQRFSYASTIFSS